ncbi:MAG TPA: TonB C-terminal domain-containing protein [Steroidobacteraceae bacterium]|nr:TonB C-terminal domain-containing protein [Steroidobacteraceae bacterium]
MDRRHRLLKRAPLLGGVLSVAILIAVMVHFIRSIMTSKQEPRQAIQMVTLIRPPPPPPIVKPPPPPPAEKVEQPLPRDTPQPTPKENAPAPSPQLGLDATGAAGSDAFGLAARPGGADLVGTGGAVFAWYTSRLASAMQDRLSSDASLRGKQYTGSVYVWIAADGSIKDVRLAASTGDRGIDTTIARDLSSMGRIGEAPPLEMPQPVRLQIVSRS